MALDNSKPKNITEHVNFMLDFKSKFNYLVLLLRLLFLIFFIGFFFLFLFKEGPLFYKESGFTEKVILGLISGCTLLAFLSYRFGKVLLMQRQNIIITHGRLSFRDAITLTTIQIDKSLIKGFSTSYYPTTFWNFKSIILYCQNSDKKEFPQFLYWNFKEIKSALEGIDIKYLGDEPYRWKWFDSRRYLYD